MLSRIKQRPQINTFDTDYWHIGDPTPPYHQMSPNTKLMDWTSHKWLNNSEQCHNGIYSLMRTVDTRSYKASYTTLSAPTNTPPTTHGLSSPLKYANKS